MELTPEPGETWRHSEEEYTVTIQGPEDQEYKVKDDNASAWRNAIVYQRDDDEEGHTLFVRSREDFISKFQIVSQL